MSDDSFAERPARPQADIFRADFMEDYRRRSSEGEVLRLAPGWIEPAFWICVLLALMVVAYVLFGQTEESASGPGAIRGVAPQLTVVAALPERLRPLVHEGLPLRLRRAGQHGFEPRFVISAVDPVVADSVGLRWALGDSAHGIAPALLVHAMIPAEEVRKAGSELSRWNGVSVWVEVPLRKRRVLEVLFSGAKGRFGGAHD